ncbi:MAG: DUF3526 domain-containing protein [Pseudomonadota bacterium]
MSSIGTIARAEFSWLARSRLAQISGWLFAALLALCVITSNTFLAQQTEHRQSHQDEASEIFANQPDRHPHRMVHYGQYVFRTPAPLASIDPGLDAYGGTSLFLEGHRKNAAMFAGAGEGAALVRLGSLTPAFCLQVLAPLLLILIGHGSITRERETGTLKALMAQGISLRDIAIGKLVVLFCVCTLCVAVLALAAISATNAVPNERSAALTLVAAYGTYLTLWALVVITVSCLCRQSSNAFLTLAAFWLLSTLVIPRFAADIAKTSAPLESAFARHMQVTAELRALGDSHNANDPNYQDFQTKVLAEYGVASPEELPINIRGLLAVEGERQGAQVLKRFSTEDQQARQAQQQIITSAGALSPMLVLQTASQAIAGTDLRAYHRFLDEAEAYRLQFVQTLNMLQATEVDYALDRIKSIDVQAEQSTRVSADAWRQLPAFSFAPAPAAVRIGGASSSLLLLLLWFGAGGCLFLWSTRWRPL